MSRSNDTSGILVVGGAAFAAVGGIWFLVTKEYWFFPAVLGALFVGLLAAKAVSK